MNSETNTITPPGTAGWDWRINISDDFWQNTDRLKQNNIIISFTFAAQKALLADFNSRFYLNTSPWPSQPFSYPAGT
ncbi:hypothetical protein UZ717_17325, partial [Lactiplantibacillus plantarum]|uniref:hypothetical protein n=1 Tax=Lactiplantibacillus plantarum TaxID=1590 RepID=UPI002AB3FDB9